MNLLRPAGLYHEHKQTQPNRRVARCIRCLWRPQEIMYRYYAIHFETDTCFKHTVSNANEKQSSTTHEIALDSSAIHTTISNPIQETKGAYRRVIYTLDSVRSMKPARTKYTVYSKPRFAASFLQTLPDLITLEKGRYSAVRTSVYRNHPEVYRCQRPL